MILQAVLRGFGGRPAQFMLHGALAAACASFGATSAAASFLSTAGPDALPVYYLLFACLSVPVSVLFSGVIDRWQRSTLMTALLTVFGTLCPLLLLLSDGGRVASTGLYIIASVGELLIYSLYYILFSDHFTVTESKRYGAPMTVSVGLGAVAGALLISPATALPGTAGPVVVLAGLCTMTIAHLQWLCRRTRPLDEVESGTEESILDSLKTLPQIARRHPLVPVMAVTVFVNVISQCFLEFEAYSIYEQSFPDPAGLSRFLGMVNAGVDAVGVLMVLALAPLIPRLGIARVSLLPPLMNLLLFICLSLTSHLGIGVLAHFNYYTLEHGLTVPLFALIYHALPHRFIGRVRVINDGVVYPLALAAAGATLLPMQSALSLQQIALGGLALSVVYMGAQWLTGRLYGRSLLAMLRDGAVVLDRMSEEIHIPEDTRGEIQTLLAGQDPATVALGLDLAARCPMPLPVADLEPLLPLIPRPTVHRAFRAARQADRRRLGLQIDSLSRSDDPRLRTLSVDLAAALPHTLPSEDLLRLRTDPDGTVSAAAIALSMTDRTLPTLRIAPDPAAFSTPLSAAAAEAALNVLEQADTLPLPVILALSHHPAPDLRARALSVATPRIPAGSGPAEERARTALTDPDPAVRTAGLTLLAAACADAGQICAAAGTALNDPAPAVRRAAAALLGQAGAPGLTLLAARLTAPELQTVLEAVDGIGQAPAKDSDELLFRWLNGSGFPLVRRNSSLRRTLPLHDPAWAPLKAAVENSDARLVHCVLHALEALGYRRTLTLARTALYSGNPRNRANALEALQTLAHRRYVLPLLPLLDRDGTAEPPQPAVSTAGALQNPAFLALLTDDDPFIRAAARQISATPLPPEEDLPMNRLVFLKSVPLFSGLLLDDMLAVEKAMTPESYLPGETIMTEGEDGDRLFLVFRGEVTVHKQQTDGSSRILARLGPGAVFGEMSLFGDEPRSASVSAVTDTDLLALDRDRFQSLAFQRPEIPMQLCRVLAQRLRVANTQ